jgi:putative transposase
MATNDTQNLLKEHLDHLLAGRGPKTVLDSSGLVGELKRAPAERMLNAEMGVYLTQEAEVEVANHRYGTAPRRH